VTVQTESHRRGLDAPDLHSGEFVSVLDRSQVASTMLA
jgi:hypothetical protein